MFLDASAKFARADQVTKNTLILVRLGVVQIEMGDFNLTKIIAEIFAIFNCLFMDQLFSGINLQFRSTFRKMSQIISTIDVLQV